ncbi:glycoside hydrolase family 32 protein [Halobellus limi]|uniref:beta-fructofuranosidase n=1 Tax=Halobellus limi TaxID=699433 RepID=A0A1H6C4I5_9EURY|nr:glycoside hydrolase family 32 protein [Halobellus limi]QCC48596.1 glycoside hydrolase family 32 protein [Halobellus limi]SEG67617.1 beta-fructofuranosidase [Halobellus limi]
MVSTPVRVGFLVDGRPSDQQAAAREWASDRYDLDVIEVDDVAASTSYDVIWWHREEELRDIDEDVASALEGYVRDGGGLLLGLRAVSAVEPLGIDPVAPDAVGTASVSAPAGLLWRSVYDDHPAVEGFDGLRIPIADHGTVPFARYEAVLPAEGEVLAATVEGEHDRPVQTSVVSWHHGDGAVLGASALAFGGDPAEEIAANRDRVAAGFLESLAAGPDSRFDRPTDREGFERLRARLRDDPHRPRFHVTSPANWINDPNGLIEHEGRYHVFYQYNPAGPYHHAIHWGHAVSDDLVHWRDEPLALAPTPDGPDRDGCWSGCAIDDEGTPTLLYTGGRGRKQLPCLATATDGSLRSWRKDTANPIIEEAPTDLDILETEHWEAEFRDHCVWREDGLWHQIIGSGVTDVGGTALHYTAEDLRDWTYEGPLLVGEGPDSGAVWECPELLRLGEKELLHVSNYEDVVYFIGERGDGGFEVDSRGLLDHGDFYAPQSMAVGDGYLTWGWLPEARDNEAQWDAGWSGALSVPRRIDVDESGDLRQRPAAELKALRETQYVDSAAIDLDDERRELPASGRTLELTATMTLRDADAVTLSVFESPDRRERTEISYTAGNELVVDRSNASEDHRARSDEQRMEVTPYDEPLSLRLFLDGSVIEAFVNDRHCLTSRVYPTRDDSTGLAVAAVGGRAEIGDFSVWELGDAWPTAEERTPRSTAATR